MDINRRASHLSTGGDRSHPNPSKSPMFTLAERLAMVERETAGSTVTFESSLRFAAEICRTRGRDDDRPGLRAVADF